MMQDAGRTLTHTVTISPRMARRLHLTYADAETSQMTGRWLLQGGRNCTVEKYVLNGHLSALIRCRSIYA